MDLRGVPPLQVIDGDRQMNFVNCGYYITEPIEKPEYISLDCKYIITASNCICDHHPSLYGSFWPNHADKQKEYQRRLGLSDKEFEALKKMVAELFNAHKLDVDSRLASRPDALNLYTNYFHSLPNAKLISIGLENSHMDDFLSDVGGTSNISAQIKESQANGHLLGYDILGWDIGFHSYLCNGLEKDISREFSIEINEFGLIQNPYGLVKRFCEHIAGMGEDVLWLPFAVYEHRT